MKKEGGEMVQRLLLSAMVGLLVFACYPSQEFDLNEPFELAYRATKTNSDEDIRIRFEGVVSDERCPVEYNCLLPGNAAVRLSFWKHSQKETFILNTNDDPRDRMVKGYAITLRDLQPPNSVDDPPARSDYVVTLTVHRQGSSCWSDKECAADEYCFFQECTQETGSCRSRPEVCITVYDPVCGCDGQTYANACAAAMQGVSVDYDGACE